MTCDSPPVTSSPSSSFDDVVLRLRASGCVFAEEEAALILEAGGDVDDLVARRAAGEPLEWVLGWAEFGPLRVSVRPGVFVPRRRTELLAAAAIARLGPASVAVDLCCGSGAIAAAIVAEVPFAEVYATDIDPVAVACARENLPTATVLCGDLLDPLPSSVRGRVDVLVANTPYVPSAEVANLPADFRDHEPRHTLDGGPDGLTLLRRIAEQAPSWMRPGGALLIEVGASQREAALEAYEDAGLSASYAEDEDGTTVVIGRLP
ncbi:MAG: putative protein N(5)-glutamine methyltransferase [Nocardioidaceae bacterium]|nr:putative protein N(5)-glutamine methyltransferase [Nocardioidaceae bacterium]